MKFYKVIVNGTVIDVNHVWLKWQPKHRVMIGCEAADAQFIQSSDQDTIWRVPWLNTFPDDAGEFETVQAMEITEEEYIALKAQLDDGDEVIEPSEPEMPTEEPEEPDPQPPSETVMTTAEMRRKITELETQLQEQAARNDMLEGCLVEMSEIVYD